MIEESIVMQDVDEAASVSESTQEVQAPPSPAVVVE
eukprot:CAMPEP_0194068498 /NCGR_PEP_ID=MMETSP0009_2-20130614/87130_1 /TAXON_ID=210454 /ORGANISM="Grammatophora oceanica, Strain CCMP 410" /LENGTH=35 /DNA_ID= /DNA_START= /DNA_END= /DNA_ORIENTATION=